MFSTILALASNPGLADWLFLIAAIVFAVAFVVAVQARDALTHQLMLLSLALVAFGLLFMT